MCYWDPQIRVDQERKVRGPLLYGVSNYCVHALLQILTFSQNFVCLNWHKMAYSALQPAGRDRCHTWGLRLYNCDKIMLCSIKNRVQNEVAAHITSWLTLRHMFLCSEVFCKHPEMTKICLQPSGRPSIYLPKYKLCSIKNVGQLHVLTLPPFAKIWLYTFWEPEMWTAG